MTTIRVRGSLSNMSRKKRAKLVNSQTQQPDRQSTGATHSPNGFCIWHSKTGWTFAGWSENSSCSMFLSCWTKCRTIELIIAVTLVTLRPLYSKDQCINEWKYEQNAITSLYYRRSNDVYIFTKLREWQGHTLIWIRLERLECERCVLQRSDCVVCGTWNNLNVTRVLWQNANVCVVMKC